MARRALTVEVDEKPLTAARAVAERAGVPADELYERALRDVLDRDFAGLLQNIAADQEECGVTGKRHDQPPSRHAGRRIADSYTWNK